MADISEQQFGAVQATVDIMVKSVDSLTTDIRANTLAQNKQTVAVGELIVRFDTLSKTVDDHEKRIKHIEGKDASTVSKWKSSLISTITNNIGTIIFAIFLWAVVTWKGGA